MGRVLWVALGATVTVLAVRQAVRQLNGEEFGEFLAQVRQTAAEREAELRAALGLDGRHDVVDVVDIHTVDNRSADAGIVGENH
ncbi:MAG: hypothetical protein ABJC62_12970 [Frankiaceae bacterium]